MVADSSETGGDTRDNGENWYRNGSECDESRRSEMSEQVTGSFLTTGDDLEVDEGVDYDVEDDEVVGVGV